MKIVQTIDYQGIRMPLVDERILRDLEKFISIRYNFSMTISPEGYDGFLYDSIKMREERIK